MRILYLPTIPSPVTDYAKIRKALQNFESVRSQFNPSQSLESLVIEIGIVHGTDGKRIFSECTRDCYTVSIRILNSVSGNETSGTPDIVITCRHTDAITDCNYCQQLFASTLSMLTMTARSMQRCLLCTSE
jgi:hypothetical protein